MARTDKQEARLAAGMRTYIRRSYTSKMLTQLVEFEDHSMATMYGGGKEDVEAIFFTARLLAKIIEGELITQEDMQRVRPQDKHIVVRAIVLRKLRSNG